MGSGKRDNRLAYMKLYVADILADEKVDAMSAEDFGAYMRLLLRGWQQVPGGTLPNDEETLARWARMHPKRWESRKATVMAPYRLGDDGRWHQRRQEAEYAKALVEYEGKRAGGQKGGRGRPVGNTPDQQQDTYSSPTGNATYPQPEPQLKPHPQPPEGDASAGRAKREAEAASQARCYISAECPSFLRSGVAPLSRLILRLGRDEAIRQCEQAICDPNVGNPFAYVETKLDNMRARAAVAPVAAVPEPPRSRKSHS